MKKQYIEPVTSACDVELTNMLATSPGIAEDITVDEGSELVRESNPFSQGSAWEW